MGERRTSRGQLNNQPQTQWMMRELDGTRMAWPRMVEWVGTYAGQDQGPNRVVKSPVCHCSAVQWKETQL